MGARPVVRPASSPGWRDNVAAKEKWLAAHPGWKHQVNELEPHGRQMRGWEHVITAPYGTEYKHHDLGALLDRLPS
jgi:hypothetical protein